MSIQYDYKMRGLLVETTEEELQNMAKEVCKQNTEEDLLNNDIHHVTYMLPVSKEDEKKKAWFWLVLIFLVWIIMLIVMLSGLYQIGRWIIDWVY